MGCRFAGAPGVESFWRVLYNARETTRDYPGGRFADIDAVYRAGSGIATSRGGFLEDVDKFDAQFFGIAPREAALLDPQQRLLLEVAWQAVEDAGIPVEKIAGSQTGVFIGLWNSDYEGCLREQPCDADFYATTGGGRYPASGRLAYFFDLRGPNLVVDTACSSSLVAIHLACQSLRQGESEMALAGGANVILRPEISLAYSAAKMLSPDGRSKFGDAAANGYVRSEGAGIVLLKPLSLALDAADPIYAVIRGSAVNNDGRSSGLLISPSRVGQETLLRSAFRDAGVDPGDVDYIEAHGAGTVVGDPIEIEAIGRVVDTAARKRPCFIGSVKTNIGHTESAAGVAGVIKVALSLERGAIPASLHMQEPNPAILWNQIPVAVPLATASWPDTGSARLAGVSGFGITGTNAHVVLEEFDAVAPKGANEASELVFLLSAHSPAALREVATAWRERLQADLEWPASLAGLAYTAAVRRTHQEYRLSITASSRAELENQLSEWLNRRSEPPGPRLGAGRSKAVFVFPGQGGQWFGMAQELMADAVFRDALARCDHAIHKYTGWSVTERLLNDEAGQIQEIEVVQPCLLAIMVALAALWRSWGIEPDAVVGHSMGESAAAAVSGALSLDDAAAVICHRSRLMKRAAGQGLMAVAELSLEDAEALAREYQGRVSVAANNSPASTVFSGDADAIEDVIRSLDARNVFCRRINVDVASHSSHMEPLESELADLLRDITPRIGSIPLYSTTSGRIEDGSGLDAEYWRRNLRQPVRFSSAVQDLLRDGFGAFIEVNPHPVLLLAIEEGIRHAGSQAVAVASLRRDRPERAEMLNAMGALHVAGFPIDFRKLYPQGACLRLPAYRWQGERHWVEAESAARPRTSVNAGAATECGEDMYAFRWFEEPAPPAPSKVAGVWILLGGVDDAAAQLAAQLQASGENCICAPNAEQFRRALQSCSGFCRGVVHLPGTRSADGWDAMVEALNVVRGMRAATAGFLAGPPPLWLLTTGVWHLPRDTGDVCAAQSPAWGLGRVIAREHPELRCVNVDLSSLPDETEMAAAAELLICGGLDEQVAVRGRKRFVARYERVAPSNDGVAPQFRADATYLITGGLGGIGLKVARWMANLGARHVALVGRRGPSDKARAQIDAIESLGVSVRVFSADIADDAQVSAVLKIIGSDMPPLRGLFHLAVVTDGAMLDELDEERLHRVMRPKAAAGWTLHQHLEHTDLDFFVLFSSIAAAIGQPGLGSYAAANAYVDALARYRHARGLAAQSIQWGPWLSTGLSTGEKAQGTVERYGEMGVRTLSAEGALGGLRRVMMLDLPNVLVLPVSWKPFVHSFENEELPRAFLRVLPKSEPGALSAPAESLREKLLGIEPGVQRRNAIEASLQEKLAAVLKTDVSRIDPEKPFASLGLDSLMALEFVRRMAAATSLRLPVTTVFNYPTIRALAREVARRMGILLDAVASNQLAPEKRAPSTPAAFTEEEAIAALMGKGDRRE